MFCLVSCRKIIILIHIRIEKMAKTYTAPSGRKFGRYETLAQVKARSAVGSSGGGGGGSIAKEPEVKYFYNPATGLKTYRAGGAAPPAGAVEISVGEYKASGVSVETRSKAGQFSEVRPGVFQRIEPGGALRTQYRGEEAEGFGRAGEVSVFQAEKAASQLSRDLGDPDMSLAVKMNIPPDNMKTSAFDVQAEERANVEFMRRSLGQGVAESYLAPPGSLPAYIQQREFYGGKYKGLPSEFKGYVAGVPEGADAPESVIISPVVAGRIRTILPVAETYRGLTADIGAYETRLGGYEQRVKAYDVAKTEPEYQRLKQEEAALSSMEAGLRQRSAEYETMLGKVQGVRARSELERFQALQESVKRDQGLLSGGLIKEYQQRYKFGEAPETGLLYSKEFGAEREKVKGRVESNLRELYLMAGEKPPEPSLFQKGMGVVSVPFVFLQEKGEGISAGRAGVALSNVLEPVIRPDFSATEYLSTEVGGRVLKPFTIAFEKYERAGVKPPGIVKGVVEGPRAIKPLIVGVERGAKEYVAYQPGGVAVDFALGYGVGKAIKVGGVVLGAYGASGPTATAKLARYGTAVKVGRGFKYAGYGVVGAYTVGVGVKTALTPGVEAKGAVLGEEAVRLGAFIGGAKAAVQQQYNVPVSRFQLPQRGGGTASVWQFGAEAPGKGFTFLSYIKGEGVKVGAPKTETFAKYVERMPAESAVQIGGGMETNLVRRFMREGPYFEGRYRLEPVDRWRAEQGIDTGQMLVKEGIGVESKFKGDLPKTTERLPEEGVDVVLGQARKYKLTLKGSFIAESEMPKEFLIRGKEFVYTKKAGDIDVEAFGRTPEEVVKLTAETASLLKARGVEARTAVPEGGLIATQIEVKQPSGVWEKAVEFLGGWSPEMAKSKVLGYPLEGPKTFKEGVETTKLAQEQRGAIQGLFRLKRTSEGYDLMAEAKRLPKDTGATFARSIGLKESTEGAKKKRFGRVIEDFESLYPYEDVYSQVGAKDWIVDYTKAGKGPSMVPLGQMSIAPSPGVVTELPMSVSVRTSAPSPSTPKAGSPYSLYYGGSRSSTSSSKTSPLSPSYPSPPSPVPPSPSPPSPSYPSAPSPSYPSPPSPSYPSPPSVSLPSPRPSPYPSPFLFPGYGGVAKKAKRVVRRKAKRPYRYTPDVYNIVGAQIGAKLPKLAAAPAMALTGLELRPLVGGKKKAKKKKKAKRRRKK